jgi:hypothetical protein
MAAIPKELLLVPMLGIGSLPWFTPQSTSMARRLPAVRGLALAIEIAEFAVRPEALRR